MHLYVADRREPSRTVLEVSGEIDAYTAPALREELQRLTSAGQHHLVVDLRQVTFLDSSALGALFGGLKATRAHHGSFALVCSDKRLLTVLDVAGMRDVFTVHHDLPPVATAAPPAPRERPAR